MAHRPAFRAPGNRRPTWEGPAEKAPSRRPWARAGTVRGADAEPPRGGNKEVRVTGTGRLAGGRCRFWGLGSLHSLLSTAPHPLSNSGSNTQCLLSCLLSLAAAFVLRSLFLLAMSGFFSFSHHFPVHSSLGWHRSSGGAEKHHISELQTHLCSRYTRFLSLHFCLIIVSNAHLAPSLLPSPCCLPPSPSLPASPFSSPSFLLP